MLSKMHFVPLTILERSLGLIFICFMPSSPTQEPHDVVKDALCAFGIQNFKESYLKLYRFPRNLLLFTI